MNRELLRQLLGYYRDLGIHTLYKRQPALQKPTPALPAARQDPDPSESGMGESSLSFLAPPPGGGLFESAEPESSPETLLQILADIGDCTRCRLHEGRSKIVFGAGNEKSPLVFVGEGPGADEDAQGLPFVGRAGQLLTQMIEGTARKEGIPLKREDVYICNVVKCRPPENRTPQPDEMDVCGQFLFRQLIAIRPKAICALGATAARALLERKEGVTKMRGNWYRWRGIPVMVTYHPSYLLRPYNQSAKREAWEDLKKVLHYVYD